MNKDNPIRILLADDHTMVREGLIAMLEQEQDMAIAGEASNGKEAVEKYRELQPDVTLMELRMPQMDGANAIKEICGSFPQARVIVLTSCDGEEDIYRGLHAGARGYLLKDTGRQELHEAIRTVHAGRTHISPGVAIKLASRVTQRDLTSREQEVLELMAAGKSNHEIATTLFISEATVKTHVNSIFSKMNVNGRTQAVTVALRRGLVHLE